MKLFCKICGITRQEDLDKAQQLGANMCGFIFHNKSPRAVTVQEASALRSHNILRVGVFVEQKQDEIQAIMEKARLDFAQLHGNQSVRCAKKIGIEKIIRVLWPEKYDDTYAFQKDLEAFHETCTYFLFDTGKLGGGSGKTMNLEKLAILKNLKKPWILAGGIGEQNVLNILSVCKKYALPNGIDCNSALEKKVGLKDHKRMQELFNRLKEN